MFEGNEAPFWGVEADGFKDPQSLVTQIQLNKFKPRDYQEPAYDAFFRDRKKRMVVIYPRRSGKDLLTWNIVIREAITKIGIYYVVYPTYSQGKKILWNSVTNDGVRFLDYIPKEMIASTNSQEMRINLLNGSFIQVIGSDNPDCFDDKTEILTENGWKLFSDLNKTEKVATLKDGYLVYDNPTAYISKPYTGMMHKGLNSSLDFLVTQTHRFYVKSNKGFYKFKNINDLSLSGDSVPSTCKWDGENKNVFTFPVISNEWICGKGRVCKKEYNRTMRMEDFVAFLGIFLAEGCTFKNHKTYKVTITQKKEHIRKKIELLLDKCGLNYSVNRLNYDIEDKQLYEYFSKFGLQKDRFIPKEIKNLSVKYLNILFEWLIIGDGSIHKRSGGIVYYSISKKLIDDVQEIAIKLGYSGNVSIKSKKGNKNFFKKQNRWFENKHDLYQFGLRTSKFKRFASSRKSYISQESYSGMIYCVSVPSGTIKVRRNGKEMWSGNSIVGTNPCGVVYSEYALQNPRIWALMSPILTANGGWAIFQGTPRGKQHFYELYELARTSPDWWCCKLGLNETKHIPVSEIQREVNEGLMSEDLIQQEYYCSFDAGVEGSYYAKYLDRMNLNNQITTVPWESAYPVHTAWDLGIADPTCIIFFQIVGQIVKIIDFYSKNLEGLEHHIRYLQSKPYSYGTHIAPFDIMVKEQTTGMTRKEKAAQLGIDFKIAPSPKKVSRQDGIEAVRALLGKLWIDENKCKILIKAIENYRREYDAKLQRYKEVPRHDKYSDPMDALRYAAISLPDLGRKTTPEDLKQAYHDAVASGGNLPPQFQTTKEHVFSNPIVNEW